MTARRFAIVVAAVAASCNTGELDTSSHPDSGVADAAGPGMDATVTQDGAMKSRPDTATADVGGPPEPDAFTDAALPPDADPVRDTGPDATMRPNNVPAPCSASGPGSGPSRSWSNAFGGLSFPDAGEPFQAIQYCFSMDQTTAVSFQIDPADDVGFFETHNGSGTAFGPVRWRAEFSACQGRFTASDTSPCAIDQNNLRLEWARGDLADQNPDRCILEPGTTYYLNVRVATPQPNTYCTNSSGIELDPSAIFCGGANPVGVCPMIPDGGAL